MTDDERLVDEFAQAVHYTATIGGRRLKNKASAARAALLAALRERGERVEKLEKAIAGFTSIVSGATGGILREWCLNYFAALDNASRETTKSN